MRVAAQHQEGSDFEQLFGLFLGVKADFIAALDRIEAPEAAARDVVDEFDLINHDDPQLYTRAERRAIGNLAHVLSGSPTSPTGKAPS